MHHLGYCKFNLLCSMLYAGLELLKRDSFQLRSVQHCTAKLLSQGCPVLLLLHHPGAVHPWRPLPTFRGNKSGSDPTGIYLGISLSLLHKVQPKHPKHFSLT